MHIHAFNKPTKPNSELKSLLRPEFENIIKVGNFTYGEPPNIRYWGEDYKLEIGNFCSLADNINIFLGGNHQTRSITTSPLQIFFGKFEQGKISPSKHKKKRSLKIGNDVWLGSGCTIMSGIEIGDGAVVGARAVIASNVPPYAFVIGNPGRVVKYRFEPDIIQRLLKLQWWEWPPEIISKHLTELTSEPTHDLIDKLFFNLK